MHTRGGVEASACKSIESKTKLKLSGPPNEGKDKENAKPVAESQRQHMSAYPGRAVASPCKARSKTS